MSDQQTRYRVSVPVHAVWTSVITADSAEEALDKAETGTICAQCQGWGKSHESLPSLDLADDADWDNAMAEEVTG